MHNTHFLKIFKLLSMLKFYRCVNR